MGRLIEADDSVLFVIDVQPAFLGKVEPGVADDLTDRIGWLVTLANRLDVPVLVTEEEPVDNGATHETVVAALGATLPRHAKPTFGLAGTPHLLDSARSHSRRTAVLVGLETDVCVTQSALGLLDDGWTVAVVVDAVASPGSSHEQGLQRMHAAGAVLVGTKGLAYEWLRSVDRLHLRPERPPAGIVL